MRFLMLNWRDPRNPKAGGAERVSLGYLAALVRRGHNVCWFANQFPDAPVEDEIEGVRIVRSGGIGTSIARARAWYHTQQPFDLVIDQFHGLAWFAPWWCGTRCVAYLHELLGPIWESTFPWPLSLLGRMQEALTYRLYREVPFWTCSQSTARGLNRFGVAGVTVIPNGVQIRPLDVLESKPLKPPIRLTAVSRLAPHKRMDHAIRVAGRLHERGIDAELTIVGDGECEAALKRLANEMNLNSQVHFPGRLEEQEKNDLLRRAHFLLHPSMREGWGLNVIEANALGTPAVVYPVAGLVDSTIADVTGWVTADEDPAAMAGTICGLLDRPKVYEQVRVDAWHRAAEFHWDRILPGACEWLERMARGESQRSGTASPG